MGVTRGSIIVLTERLTFNELYDDPCRTIGLIDEWPGTVLLCLGEWDLGSPHGPYLRFFCRGKVIWRYLPRSVSDSYTICV